MNTADCTSFLEEARKVATGTLKNHCVPTEDDVFREARFLVRKRIKQTGDQGRTPVDDYRAEQVMRALTRCAMAMIEQWFIAKGSEVWPPMH